MDYCSDYVIKDTKKLPIPDFSIKVDIEDINFERDKSAAEDIKEGIPIRHFTDEYSRPIRAVIPQVPERQWNW